MRILSSLFIAAVLISPATAQSPEGEEEAVRALWERFEQFFEVGDAEGIASLYALNADRISSSQLKAQGRAQVWEQYRTALAQRDSNPDTIRPYHADITLRFLRPDVAILDGISTPTPGVKSHFTVVVTKENGQWWIAAGRDRQLVQE